MTATNKKTKLADWYDYPQYFDMLFRDETAAEVFFFEAAFERFVRGPIRRLLEPGCGSGRLVVAMASRGYEVTGLDLSLPMLRYLDKRIKRRGLKAETVLGDMTQMPLEQTFDAAFCTFNTFRHLLDEKAAIAHLRSVAQCVRPGGIYILGFHIIPLDAEESCTERWRASHGGTKLSATLRVIDFDRSQRQEKLRISILATKRSGEIERIQSEFALRLYTASEAKRMFATVKDQWEIVKAYDFDYDIDASRVFDDDLTDSIFILRRTER